MFFVSQIAKMFRYFFQKKENSSRTLLWHSKQRKISLNYNKTNLHGHRVFFPAFVSNVFVFSCILFILLSRESDQCAARACLGKYELV